VKAAAGSSFFETVSQTLRFICGEPSSSLTEARLCVSHVAGSTPEPKTLTHAFPCRQPSPLGRETNFDHVLGWDFGQELGGRGIEDVHAENDGQPISKDWGPTGDVLPKDKS
jgi:hypothetical protein